MAVDSSSRIVLLGGTSGIGLAIARLAAEAGASVVIGSRSPASIERALAELPAGVEGEAVDATSTSDLERFFASVGEMDHFAYTAADNLTGVTLADYTVEQGERFFALRLVHALDALRVAAPRVRPGGSITLTSGTAAYKGSAGWMLGAAVSGAMISIGRTLAVELAPVRVNVVAPGVMRSPLWASMEEADREAMYEAVAASLPLGRVGEPQDAARAYLTLMEQDYVTGTVSVVDGGTLVA